MHDHGYKIRTRQRVIITPQPDGSSLKVGEVSLYLLSFRGLFYKLNTSTDYDHDDNWENDLQNAKKGSQLECSEKKQVRVVQLR